MLNSEKKIIAIDLDGTTLQSDGKSLSSYSLNVFKRVQKAGHLIIIATGRPYRMSIACYEQIGLTGPMINFNGALTSLPGDAEWSHNLKLHVSKAVLIDLLKHQQSFDLDFIAAEYRRKFFLNTFKNVDPDVFGVEQFEPYHKLRMDRIDSDPHALLISTRSKDKITVQEQIQNHFGNEITVSAWGGPNGILEIVPHGVNKAYALKHLLKNLGRDRKNLIAFGDEYNDVEMFQLAQTGYAVKNASDRLLNHADEILPFTNDQDAVAKKLETLFLV